MPSRFEPFAGLRYDTALVSMDDVIAPPYDVVSPLERSLLASRSPYNSIRVELPDESDGPGGDRYALAAAELESWEATGALRRDDTPTLYVYRMTYEEQPGVARSTTGVIGALGIDALGNAVLPHERTMPKPKGDRLELLRACRANLSPIWGLSLAAGLADACAEVASRKAPVATARDGEGTTHELWTATDPEHIAKIRSLVVSTPVVIADGHHRYETATLYRSERRAASGGASGAYDLVMALVVELSEEELVVGAIHRLITGLPHGFAPEQELASYFEVLPGPKSPPAIEEAMTQKGALGLVTRPRNYLLRPLLRVDAEAEADLDSSRLDAAIASFPAHQLTYEHGVASIFESVRNGTAQAGVLLRPATVAQIAETAHSGRRMPPKTTFFHPKPRTGMVFRSLDEKA